MRERERERRRVGTKEWREERERENVRVQDQPREKCLEGLTAKLPLTLPSLLSMPSLSLSLSHPANPRNTPCLSSRADSFSKRVNPIMAIIHLIFVCTCHYLSPRDSFFFFLFYKINEQDEEGWVGMSTGKIESDHGCLIFGKRRWDVESKTHAR